MIETKAEDKLLPRKPTCEGKKTKIVKRETLGRKSLFLGGRTLKYIFSLCCKN